MHIANCDIYITDCNICQGVKRRSIRGLISSTEPQTSKYRLLKERTGGHQKSCRNTLTDRPRRAGKSPGDVLRFFGGRNLSDEGQHERFTLSLWQQTNSGRGNRNPSDTHNDPGKDATPGNSLLVFLCREIQQSLKFQSFDFLQSFAGDALKIAIHTDGRLHHPVDLLFALGPLFGDGFSLAIEVLAHRRKGFNYRLNSLAKARTGEIAVDHVHLCLLPFRGLSRASNFDQSLAQRDGHRESDFGVSNPNLVDQAKCFDVFGQNLTDNHSDLGLGSALVFTQLGQPPVVPVFSSLRFPKNCAALLTHWVHDPVEDVAAEFAFGDGLDGVAREAAAEQTFNLQFLNLALKLLRALFGTAF